MSEDLNKLFAALNGLAAAVANTARDGSLEDKEGLIAVLNEMNGKLPAVSEDALGAKDFLSALVSLLEGRPTDADELSGTFREIYVRILESTLKPVYTPKGPACVPASMRGETELKEFLTHLSATVVLMMRKGSPDEKGQLAGKLREMESKLEEGSREAGPFILALAGVLEGARVEPDALPPRFTNIFRKILETIDEG